jgi:hypothetical protein
LFEFLFLPVHLKKIFNFFWLPGHFFKVYRFVNNSGLSMSSSHFSLHSCAKACCSIGNWSKISIQSCKSCMLLSLLHTEDNDNGEVPSELFNLCKLSSNCDIRRWGVEGKLLLQRCRELFVFVSVTAIFFFLIIVILLTNRYTLIR